MRDRICSAPHCDHPAASRYSPYCRHHKSVHRRQGAPTQRGVTKTELAPWLSRIEARIAKNPDSEAWPLLEEAWAAIVTDARGMADHNTGNRYARSAASEIVAIAGNCAPGDVVRTVLAMVLLWHDRPLRFASDRALRVQIARRVQALSRHHVGLRHDHRTGQQVRVYREMTPKAAHILGHRLMTAFGGIGLQLAALDDQERQAAQEAKQRLATAISQLN